MAGEDGAAGGTGAVFHGLFLKLTPHKS